MSADTRERHHPLPPNLPPRGLCREEAAAYIGIGPSKFDALVAAGDMPKPLRIGTRVIWDRRALDRAFDALSESTTGANPWDEALK